MCLLDPDKKNGLAFLDRHGPNVLSYFQDSNKSNPFSVDNSTYKQRMSEPSSMQYKQMECSVIERYSVTFFAEPNFPTLCSYTCKWIDGSLSMNCLES